jgi:hypothetical protein
MTDDQQLAAEELKLSRNRAWWHQRPTNNMFEVWQNMAPFSGRPIGGAVEALSTQILVIGLAYQT